MAAEKIIILSQGSAPLLVIQCREFSLENVQITDNSGLSKIYMYAYV